MPFISPQASGPFSSKLFETVLQLLLRLAMLLFTAAAALLLLEGCNRGDIKEALLWLRQNPGLAFVSWSLLAALVLWLYSLCRKPAFASGGFLLLCCLLGFAHFYKAQLKGEPLLPMDIFYVKEAALIAPSMGIRPEPILLQCLLLLLSACLLLGLAQRFLLRPLPWPRRFFLPLGWTVSILSLFLFYQPVFQTVFGLEDMRYYQNKNFDWQGFVIAEAYNMQNLNFSPVPGYSAAAVEELARSAAAAVNLFPAATEQTGVLSAFESRESSGAFAGELPHIIVLMMESYADPRILDPGLLLTPDPFQALERHAQGMQSFRLLSSMFGGSTANVEFEFLSGLSMAHLPVGAMPYAQYINRPVPALPADLAKLGYETIAIHPNRPDFYNRGNVYQNLGFQRFVSLEDFDSPVYRGYFVSEQSFGEKVKESFAARSAEKPLFCFGVSIANHGPYGTTGQVWDYDISGHTDFLEESQYQELTSGVSNLRASAEMLADLLDYFQQETEPVLVLVFGDHHPNWSWLTEDPEARLEEERYLTEGFFWSNRPLPQLGLTYVSANFLSSWLLSLTDLTLPPFYPAMLYQAQQYKAYNPYYYIDNQNQVHPLDQENVRGAGLLAYDRLFGENYLESLP